MLSERHGTVAKLFQVRRLWIVFRNFPVWFSVEAPTAFVRTLSWFLLAPPSEHQNTPLKRILTFPYTIFQIHYSPSSKNWTLYNMRHEILSAVTMKTAVLCNLTPCCRADGQECFRGTCWFCLRTRNFYPEQGCSMNLRDISDYLPECTPTHLTSQQSSSGKQSLQTKIPCSIFHYLSNLYWTGGLKFVHKFAK
jgi:hypothetical protein